MPNALKKYSEYFNIDKNYYPEINPDSIRNDKEGWLKTYPHPKFIELLELTERMLARNVTGKRHCIWVEGPFGVGKSRLMWTARELLKCPEAQLREYFDEFDQLKVKPDLRDKLLGHKRGRIVTAYRYGSGDIADTRRLIMAIYESVTEALKREHLNYIGEHTLKGQIADWLDDAEHAQIFQLLMNKPKYRNMGSFAGKTPAELVARLRGNGNVDALVNGILELSEAESIGVYRLTVADLKAWLSDVIHVNHLTALVLIWDEFSSYFRQNMNTLDQLQSLVELCAAEPFGMIIATHEIDALDPAGTNKQLSQIIRDRFERVGIEMPDNVAFDLIGHALRPNAAASGEWEVYKNDIAGRYPEARKRVVESAKDVSDKMLINMTPIHPMAALMLKYISEQFASNQRSMFNFIKNDEGEELHAFQWFIHEKSPEVPDVLTMDYLWDFFYVKGHDQHGSGAGRANLSSKVAAILDTYAHNAARLNNEQSRVLKVVLMMQAISSVLGSESRDVKILRPLENNIRLAFDGDENSFSTNPIAILKDQLVNRLHILYAAPVEKGMVEYRTGSSIGNQEEIDKIIKRLTDETRTIKLVQDGQLQSAISLTAAERLRFSFTAVTTGEFTAKVNQLSELASNEDDFHIYGVICFARNEVEQERMRKLIEEARREEYKRRLVIIDASGVPMGEESFRQWAVYAGNEEYWRPKDGQYADSFVRDNRELENWQLRVATGNLLVYYGDHFERRQGTAAKIRDTILPEIVLDRYPLSFDNARVSENFFASNYYAQGAKFGVKHAIGGIYQDKYISGMLHDVWNVQEYWKQPQLMNLPISRLKQQVDALIEERLSGGEVRVSHCEIYDMLRSNGFMPCNLYAYLTGFLLSEYSRAPYRYGIGENGDEGNVQDPETLGAHIGECFKYKTPEQGIRNYTQKYIEIMSREQKAFVDFAHDAFGVDANASVERAASSMRTKLKTLRYPIWCFKYVDRANLESFLDKIAEIANDRNSSNVPTLAGDLGRKLINVGSAQAELKDLLTEENGREGLKEFLRDYRDGELIALVERIAEQLPGTIAPPDWEKDAREALSSGEALWLWNQETGQEETDKLILKYRIVAASNQFAGNSVFDTSNSFGACMTEWKKCAKHTHIPALCIQENSEELREWSRLLRELFADGSLATEEKKQNFLAALTEHQAAIADFLNHRERRFAELFEGELQGLDFETCKSIYSQLPDSSFRDSKSDFSNRLRSAADGARAQLKITRLRAKWRELSGFDTAEDWSKHYNTPILALVPANEQEQAEKLFALLRNHYGGDAEVTAAMNFLDSNPSFVAKLKDQAEIDKAFSKQLLQEYKSIVTVEQARRAIKDRCSAEPYQWTTGATGTAAQNVVRETAEHNYYAGTNQKVLEHIDQMDPEQAKAYLRQLVKEDIEIGVRIMMYEGMVE